MRSKLDPPYRSLRPSSWWQLGSQWEGGWGVGTIVLYMTHALYYGVPSREYLTIGTGLQKARETRFLEYVSTIY